MEQFSLPNAFSSFKSLSCKMDLFSKPYESSTGLPIRSKMYASIPKLSEALEHSRLHGSRPFIHGHREPSFLFGREEDLPRFYFPPQEKNRKAIEEFSFVPKSTEFSEDPIDDLKHSECSENTQNSTKANFTREATEFESSLLNFSSSAMSRFDDITQSKVEVKNKTELLPRLNQVFDFGTFYNLSEKSDELDLELDQSPQSKVNVEDSVNLTKEVDELSVKNQKKQKKVSSNEPKDFSKRLDVVNKTILRSIKRYYVTEFDSFCNFSELDDKEKFAKFHELIRKYVIQEMKLSTELNEQELEDAIFAFGSMISHIHMRRGIKVSKLRTQVNFIHKCLYNYSHKKSQQMLQGGFKYILKDFIQQGGIDIVLNSEETMLKQKEIYKDAVNSLYLTSQL